MSEIKVNSIKGVSASTAAISIDNSSGTCTANITNNLSNKNLIINGAMEVAQRGTSGTSVGYVSLDRWYLNLSGGSGTFSQETNPNPSETTGIQKFARLNVSSSSDFTSIRQRIEDVTKVPSGTVTLSFYAKGTAPAGGLYAFTEQNFGTGGSSSVDGTPVLITSSLTSSWVRYTAQITVDSIDGKTIGSASFFQIVIGQYSNSSSTAYDLNITGVQLELGSVATDFEHRSFGQELALCQRYYYKHVEGNAKDIGVGAYYTANLFAFSIKFPVTMRAAPTLDYVSGTNFYQIFHNNTNDQFDAFSITRSQENCAAFDSSTGTSGVQGSGGILNTSNASSYVALNAEL